MEFCDKCGGLMVIEKKRKYSYLVCKRCGHEKRIKKEKLVISEEVEKPERGILVMGKGETLEEYAKTKVVCPECGNNEAYWWMRQTRGADEPPTLFYKCTECGHSWRSYG